jgi:hypothetical protein
MNNNQNDGMSREERDRIVKKVESDLAKKHFRPSTELDEMLAVRLRSAVAVRALISPIVEAAKMASPTDPNHLHSELGKARLLITMQKLYVDQLRTLSKDEAIFMLALAWAEFTLNEFV